MKIFSYRAQGTLFARSLDNRGPIIEVVSLLLGAGPGKLISI